MQNKNVSDIIEAYFKQILALDEHVEIKRAEIANLFNCVPSQINYVIKTRFTVQKGYLVESKRGGGGYIRIQKVHLADDAEMIDHYLQLIEEQIDAKNAFTLIENMYENDLITKNEATIILSAIDHTVMELNNRTVENQLRARMLISILNNLRFNR